MSETYAVWSNLLVYGATAVMTLAMLALGAEAAFGRSSRVGRRVETMAPVAVGGGVAPAAPEPPAGGVPGEVAPRAARAGAIGVSLLVLAAGLLGLAVLFRGLSAGRPPWGNMYEFAITGSFLVTVVWLGLRRRYPALRAVAVWVVTTLVLTLGLAIAVLYVPAGPLVPALRSVWLVIHVFTAMLSAAIFTVAMVASALQIVRERAERLGRADRGYVRTLPSAARLDALAYRVTAFGFPIWTFTIVAGAIWAGESWGRTWGWDPKEVWSLVTWLVYAAYLHARTTAGWQGRRASVVALVAYGTLLFNFFGVNILFSGLHSYGGL